MNGIVLLDKPISVTSFEAVRAVSRVFDREKAGHPGTLDPAASGVLPVFLGRGTKLISLLPDTDKAYVARVCLGSATDTGDAEGEICAETAFLPTLSQIEAVLPRFTGDILQTPPMYSAKKQNGVPLYKLAREGQNTFREPCPIRIESLTVSDFRGDSFSLTVRCSSGTYIRTLAEDIAKEAGSLAHLTALRRTVACGIPVEDCISLEQLKRKKEEGTHAEAVRDCEFLFEAYEKKELKGDLLRLFLNGFRFPAARAGISPRPGTRYRIYAEGSFAALAAVNAEGELIKLWQADVLQKGTEN